MKHLIWWKHLMFPKSVWKSSLLLKTKYSVTKKCIENWIVFSRLIDIKLLRKSSWSLCDCGISSKCRHTCGYHTSEWWCTSIQADRISSCSVMDSWGRNYKKLRPIVPYYKEKLEAFLERYWEFYGELSEFRIKPDSGVVEQLSTKFDQLFSTITGYEQLDERIGKTKENKEHLLKVLLLPEVPLHNNAAELAARAKVRKWDVSLQTITDEGTKANDTFMTIVQTAKKLSMSA